MTRQGVYMVDTGGNSRDERVWLSFILMECIRSVRCRFFFVIYELLKCGIFFNFFYLTNMRENLTCEY